MKPRTKLPLPEKDGRLRAVLNALYDQFEAPTPWEIVGCPCCVGKRRVDRLLSTPLRELTGDELYAYVSGVFYTVGSESDFKYLLPRILELSMTEEYPFINPEIVLTKVGLAGWQSWHGSQRQAVENAIDAWFEQAIANDAESAGENWGGSRAESVLCGIALAGVPIAGHLARLQLPDAAPTLARMRARFPASLSPFWEDAQKGYQQLMQVIGQ